MEDFIPAWEKTLHLARRSLKGLKKAQPSKAHAPISYNLTCIVANQLRGMCHLGAGIGALVAFDGYLRVSELASLRVHHVSRAGELVAGDERTLIWLGHCGTGNDQRVTVRRPEVARLL